MWWIREEKQFKIYTKYEKAFTARSVYTKSGCNGELTSLDPFDTLHPAGDIVMYVLNNGPVEPITRSYETTSHGPYKVFLSVDGKEYSEHGESYDTFARASTIVKKYLRKHYRKVLVVKVR